MGTAAPMVPSAPPTPEKARSIRGPLRYQISTSSPQLEAGTKFSIYTRITNPYDVPVKIASVTTLLPVEFIDLAVLERTRRKRRIGDLIRSTQGSGPDKQGVFSRIFKAAPSAPERLSSQPLSSEPEPDIVSDLDPFTISELIRASADPEKLKFTVLQQLHEAFAKNEEASQPKNDLQPGNSIIQVFTLKTNRSIFFPPNVYQSSVRIEYEIDGSKNIDVADYQLNIRAPLKAILYGALTGSFFGFFLKDLTGDKIMLTLLGPGHGWQGVVQYFLSLLTAMMIAGIAVVAFARKKDAQPILSVEDFWGGVFVGFLAGYSGKAFLEKAGVNPGGTAGPTPVPKS